MNVYDYIENYGDYTFDEKKFNEIDATIFSFLSYIDFSKMLPEGEALTIQEAGKNHIVLDPKKDKNIIGVKEANKIFNKLKNKNRYKNCILSNFEYIGNDILQVGAICIEYEPNKVFVSYEGTDALMSGWREDFLLSTAFPTKSHKLAIKYLNKLFTFSNKKIVLGGHSKGGNLALVAGMYSNRLVRHKITKIYSCDGPGLLDKQFKSLRYQNIRKKYIHIIPNSSIIGILLNHSSDRVVKTNKKGLIAHNIVYWEIEDNKFKRSTIDTFSKELDRRLMQWVRRTSVQTKVELTENIYDILLKANVHSIIDIKENKRKILDILSKSKSISNSTKDSLKELIYILIKSIETTKKEEFKSIINNILNIKEENEAK